MAMVNTTSGPVPADQLGFTLMHEHIMVANWSMRCSFDDYVDEEAVVVQGIADLGAARDAGVTTMVDLTPINLGRDIGIIRRVAEGSGVRVIACTGFYSTEEPWMIGWGTDELVPFLVRDIEQGIQGTDIRAGIIKCATDELGLTPLNRKLLETSARAHRQTGVPISTHTFTGNRSGLMQLEVFAEEGVDMAKLVIGHCGDTDDLGYLEQILSHGCYIGMDRFGLEQILPDGTRTETLIEMCRRGYAPQMVLSHDKACFLDFTSQETQRKYAGALPDWRYTYVPNDLVPALRSAGVSEADIHLMTVENPRRIFTGEGPVRQA